MARKYGRTLESVTKIITVDGIDLVQEEMRLGLADDELAQLCMIDFEYIPDSAEDETGRSAIALSLDPDSKLNPLTDDVEDLEYLAGMNISGRDMSIHGTIGKTLVFDDKINIGTNLGLTVKANIAARNGAEFVVTAWFIRKRASDVELAKILLKRR